LYLLIIQKKKNCIYSIWAKFYLKIDAFYKLKKVIKRRRFPSTGVVLQKNLEAQNLKHTKQNFLLQTRITFFFFSHPNKSLTQNLREDMVVIEQENTDDRNANPSNATAAVGNDASDGFETASEADLDSDGDDGGDISREEPKNRDQPKEQEGEQEQHVAQESVSSENALINEEELKQVRFSNLGFRYCFSFIAIVFLFLNFLFSNVSFC